MSTLTERKRRLVQEDVAAAALRLFRVQGYEATTVDDIAAAAGMSRRTFFRYFRSKGDVAAAKWQSMADAFVDLLGERPDEDDPWTALRAALDGVVAHYADPERRLDSYALDETVAAIPALRTAFLEQLDDTCLRAAAVLEERGVGSLEARVCARAAGAALMTAMEHGREHQEPGIGVALDEAFRLLRPAV